MAGNNAVGENTNGGAASDPGTPTQELSQ